MKILKPLILFLLLSISSIASAAPWAHADVLDNGIAYIKTNCDKFVAVISYTAADSYATVTTAGNIVAEVTMSSTDFTLATGTASARTLTSASGKQDTSANNTGNPTHFACVDTVNSKVLWVTTENTAQTVTAGNPVTFPSVVYTSNQPI